MSYALRNNFPDMSEAEFETLKRHRGSHRVVFFDQKLQSLVSQDYSSVEAFIELNGLDSSAKTYREVTSNLLSNGKYTRVIAGNTVGIYDRLSGAHCE